MEKLPDPPKWPNIYIIDNGWVDCCSKYPGINRHHDPKKKGYHGDATVDIIKESKIPNENIFLVNVLESSFLTGEPKVEKQASLQKVLDMAKKGDVMLMNMELYREPYNYPVTHDSVSLELVKALAKKRVICIFPAGNSCIDLVGKINLPSNYYILVGSKNENGAIHTSNFYSDKKAIVYVNLKDDCSETHGLTNSSAAAACITRDVIKEISNEKLNNALKSSSPPPSPPTVIEVLLRYHDRSFLLTQSMLNMWNWDLNIKHGKESIEALAKMMNPINRNIFPYPNKIKVEDEIVKISRKVPIGVLKDAIDTIKKKYLAIRICFGINDDGNILLIASGGISIDFCNDANYMHLDVVSNEGFVLNYNKDPTNKLNSIVSKKRTKYINRFRKEKGIA